MNQSNEMDKIIYRINDAVMNIDPLRNIERDPKLHIGLNPLFLTMRQEFHIIKKMNIKVRQSKMRRLLMEDYAREEKELREVELAHINTQP